MLLRLSSQDTGVSGDQNNYLSSRLGNAKQTIKVWLYELFRIELNNVWKRSNNFGSPGQGGI